MVSLYLRAGELSLSLFFPLQSSLRAKAANVCQEREGEEEDRDERVIARRSCFLTDCGRR